MVAGQKLKAADGYEVMLFPLPYMFISQGEGESYSHAGTYNIDFLGYGAMGRIFNAPYYAPCTCTCVAIISGADNIRVFQSVGKVHTPKGLEIVTFLTMHDNTPIAFLNSRFNQGDLLGHTGTAGGVTGDHVHFNTANGGYQGYEHVPPDNQGQLVNSEHIYDICYVNDTELTEDYGYPWQYYSGKTFRKSNFPWVLYANKFRNR